MKLIVLGSGTSVPHSSRAAAGYWLETDGGRMLLEFGVDGSLAVGESVRT